MKKALIIGSIATVAVLSSCNKRAECSEFPPPPPPKEGHCSNHEKIDGEDNGALQHEHKKKQKNLFKKPLFKPHKDCEDMPKPNPSVIPESKLDSDN